MAIDIVKRTREHLALNPYKMAKLLGKPMQSYQNLERHTHKITIRDLVELYKLSGVTPEIFVRWLTASVDAQKLKSKRIDR